MDVRLSAEQQALRSAAQVVGRLGPAVGDLDGAERAGKLDAASDRRRVARAAHGHRRRHSVGLGGRGGDRGEELSRGLADAAFSWAHARRRAAPPGRGAGGHRPGPWRSSRPVGVRPWPPSALPSGAVAIDAAGATSALVLVAGDGSPGAGPGDRGPDRASTPSPPSSWAAPA